MVVKKIILILILGLSSTAMAQQWQAKCFLKRAEKSLKKLQTFSMEEEHKFKGSGDKDTLKFSGQLKYAANPRDVFYGYDLLYNIGTFYDAYYSLGKTHRITHHSKKIYSKRLLDPKKINRQAGPFSENPEDGIFDNYFKDKNYISDLLQNNTLIFNKISNGFCNDTVHIFVKYTSQNTTLIADTIWDLKVDFLFDRSTKLPIQIIRTGATNRGHYFSKVSFSYNAINQDSIYDFFIGYQLPDDYEMVGKHVIKKHIAKPLEDIRPAPDFSLVDAEGNSVNLGDYKGEVVLLDFWYSTCAPCIKASKYLELYSKEYADSNFIILGMNPLDGPNKIRQHNKKWKVTYPGVICTSEVKNKYQISSYPTFILIDKKGMIVLHESGFSASLMKSIERHIQQAIRE